MSLPLWPGPVPCYSYTEAHSYTLFVFRPLQLCASTSAGGSSGNVNGKESKDTQKDAKQAERDSVSRKKPQSETERRRDVDSTSASPHSWSPLWVYCGSLLLRCKQEDLNDLYCQQNKVQSLQSQEKQFEYDYKRIQYARVINTMSAQYLWDWIGGNDL